MILGNLVTGHINKRAIDPALKGPTDGVHVRYAAEILQNMAAPNKKPLWSIEVLGAPLAPPPPAGP